MVSRTGMGRHLERFFFWLMLLAAALVPWLSHEKQKSPAEPTHFPGWPTTWEGRPLHQLPLSDRETAFASSFPGFVGRFSAGHQEIILRWVRTPTRKLHPSATCLQAIDYQITPLPMAIKTDGTLQGCLRAERNGEELLRVCEWITDGSGRSWSTVSSWYWHAFFNPKTGPWWAYTVAKTVSAPPN